MLKATRHYLAPHRHTALLVAIVATFAVRPLIGESDFSRDLFSIAVVLLLLVALYTVQVDDLMGERETLLAQRRRRSMLGWVLALVAMTARVAMFVVSSPAINVAGPIAYLLFFSYITGSQLRSLLRQREVTSETISMSISVYLLLGFSWGHLVRGLVSAGSPRFQPRSIDRVSFRRCGSRAELCHSHLFQPHHIRHCRVWRYHAVDPASPVCVGGRGHHWAVLPGYSGRAAGGNADEPIYRSLSMNVRIRIELSSHLAVCCFSSGLISVSRSDQSPISWIQKACCNRAAMRAMDAVEGPPERCRA